MNSIENKLNRLIEEEEQINNLIQQITLDAKEKSEEILKNNTEIKKKRIIDEWGQCYVWIINFIEEKINEKANDKFHELEKSFGLEIHDDIKKVLLILIYNKIFVAKRIEDLKKSIKS